MKSHLLMVKDDAAFLSMAHLGDKEIAEIFDSTVTWVRKRRVDLGVTYHEKRNTQIERAKAITEFVASSAGITRNELLVPERTKMRVRARWVAMWVARDFGYSLPVIGLALGRMDHTTVLHGIRQIEKPKNQPILALAKQLARDFRERDRC